MLVPWSPRVPLAITALVAAFKTAMTGVDVLAWDGPQVSTESLEDVVVVGWGGFPTSSRSPSRELSEQLAQPDVVVETVQQGLGPSLLETMTIDCSAMSRTGGTGAAGSTQGGPPVARARAYQLMGLAGAAITPPNHTLGGVVMKSTMSAHGQLHQVQDRRGVLAIVTFTVECVATSQQ
jgi:hypothetical protein